MNDRNNAAWQHGRQVHIGPQAQMQEAGNVARNFGSMEAQTFTPQILTFAASSMAPLSGQTQRLAASVGVAPNQEQAPAAPTDARQMLTLHGMSPNISQPANLAAFPSHLPVNHEFFQGHMYPPTPNTVSPTTSSRPVSSFGHAQTSVPSDIVPQISRNGIQHHLLPVTSFRTSRPVANNQTRMVKGSNTSMEQVRYDDPSKGIRAPYTITSRPLKYVSPNTVARDVLYALGKHDVLDHFSIGPRGVKRKRASSHENHSMTSTVGDPSQDNMTQPSTSIAQVTHVASHTMESRSGSSQVDEMYGRLQQSDQLIDITIPAEIQAPLLSGAERVSSEVVTGESTQKTPASPAVAMVSPSRTTLTHSSPVSAATKAAFLSWKSSLEGGSENKRADETERQPDHIQEGYRPSNSEVTPKGKPLSFRDSSRPSTLSANESPFAPPLNSDTEVFSIGSALTRSVQRSNSPRIENTQQLMSPNIQDEASGPLSENSYPGSARHPPCPNSQHAFPEPHESKSDVSPLSVHQPSKAPPSSSPPQTPPTCAHSGFRSTVHSPISGMHSVNRAASIIPLVNVRLPTLAVLNPSISSGNVKRASAASTKGVKKMSYPSKDTSRIGGVPYVEIPLVSRKSSSETRPLVMKSETSGGTYDLRQFWNTLRPILCNWSGCGVTLASLESLRRHIFRSHEEAIRRRIACRWANCLDRSTTFLTTQQLMDHILDNHTSHMSLCPYVGCERRVPLSNMDNHCRRKHQGERRRITACPQKPTMNIPRPLRHVTPAYELSSTPQTSPCPKKLLYRASPSKEVISSTNLNRARMQSFMPSRLPRLDSVPDGTLSTFLRGSVSRQVDAIVTSGVASSISM